MKLLKHKVSVLLAAILVLTLLLSACSTAAGETVENAASVTVDDPAADLAETAGAVSASSQSAADQADSALFSDRDLSGEYDAAGAVTIALNGSSATASADSVQISGSTVTITAAGTYVLSGSLENGSVIVSAAEDDKVQLVLDGASIHAQTYAAIYVVQADKVFLTLAEGTVNSLSNGGSFVQLDDNDVDGVIFAKDDLTLNGSGSLTVTSPAGHGIVGKDEVTITGGSYEISAASCAIRGKDSIAVCGGAFTLRAGTDGLHAENSDDDTLGSICITGGSFSITEADDGIHANTLLQIDGGEMNISAAEGLEATCIRLNGGDVSISASDDGVNAAQKSSACLATFEMNDGTLTVVIGAGDTDGIDSNGSIIVNGGTIDVTGQSAFDCDGTAQYNGGTILVNGQQVDSIPIQMMGGMGGGFGGGRR